MSSAKKLGEFAFAHKSEAERNSLSSLPRTRQGQQKLTELGVCNRTPRNRIQPVSDLKRRIPKRSLMSIWPSAFLLMLCCVEVSQFAAGTQNLRVFQHPGVQSPVANLNVHSISVFPQQRPDHLLCIASLLCWGLQEVLQNHQVTLVQDLSRPFTQFEVQLFE